MIQSPSLPVGVPRRKPKPMLTDRQIAAQANVLSGRFKSKHDAILAAGYSEKMAENPQIVLKNGTMTQFLQRLDKRSKRLYKERLIDKLANVYLEGLNATKVTSEGEKKDYPTIKVYADALAEFIGFIQKYNPNLSPFGGGAPVQNNQFNISVSPDDKSAFNKKFAEFMHNTYRNSP